MARDTAHMTQADALARLRNEVEQAGEPDVAKPERLPLTALHVAPSVFQPRALEGGLAASQRHVRNLMDAVRNAPEHLLEPLEVWWSGRAWYVIDGHHRLEAYQRLRNALRAPIKVEPRVSRFEGTLQQALARSVENNSRDKLPMTRDDKLNSAWRLVCLSELSRSEIVRTAGVAEGSVARMRRIRKTLKEKGEENIAELSWKDALAAASGEVRTFDDDWMERQAKEWAGRLLRTFGDSPQGQPEVFAMALQFYSPGLLRELPAALRWLGSEDDEPEDEFEDEPTDF